MTKTIEQMQAALDREMEYTRKLNEKIERLQEQLKNSISIFEHEKRMVELTREYEWKLSRFNLQQPRLHNERGAGRKRIASAAVVSKVLALSKEGLSQAKITALLIDVLGIKIGRTTVGEIVRGNYTTSDEVTEKFKNHKKQEGEKSA